MTYKEWIDKYKEVMNLISILDNTCPFINDKSVHCDTCKISEKCNNIVRIRFVI